MVLCEGLDDGGWFWGIFGGAGFDFCGDGFVYETVSMPFFNEA